VLGQTVVISAGPFSLRKCQSAGVDRESCTEDTVYSDCTVSSSVEVQFLQNLVQAECHA